ncbi:MAG: DUF2867 domain-containing protein [Blastocatellia bacterium]|nr:DUF2867 domain-containing protein [Blastocatellia bacterium]
MKYLHHDFERLPLRVHPFLKGIPLRSLYRLELPGGREGMTLREIQDVIGFGRNGEMETGAVTKALFDFRGWIGRLFGWDDVPSLADAVTWLSRLSEEDRNRSTVTPGTAMGISRVLYQFENEMLAEIVNRTVHCFWGMATEKTPAGYALYMAVYVKKLNWFTPIYMALITPMVKWIVYPSMMRGARRRWARAFPGAGPASFLETGEATKG